MSGSEEKQQSVTEQEQRILTFLESHAAERFELLERLVLQQSSSRYKEGVDAVGRLICEQLAASSLRAELVPESVYGDHILFRSPAWRADRPGVVLFGHMDTVFPKDTAFNWYKTDEDGGRVFGPGVIDMKGGLVVAISALLALEHCGLLEEIPLTLFCNSDEEIGSPGSTPHIVTESERALFVLGFECGGLNGEAVTGRKGRLGFTLKVHGRAGHAAFAGPDKASAVLEMAHKIIALEQLNDPQRGIVVNVGTVRGGIGPNTVPEYCEVEIDGRVLTIADAEETSARIAEIAAACRIPGTRGELVEGIGRKPMEQSPQNRALFKLMDEQAQRFGIACVEELRSGVSDANTFAFSGVPVVDGLGPIGANDHSDREYMIAASLLERSKLAALTLLHGWENYRKQ